MRPIDADTIVTVMLYDEEHEEYYNERMTIAECLDRYTEEGCPWEGEKDAQAVKIVTHGNCGRCGKPIEGDSIFLCDECISLLKGADDDTI